MKLNEAAQDVPALRAGEQVIGIAASPGIAIGPVLVRKPQAIDYPRRGESPAVELQRLDAALDKVFAEIGTLIAQSQVASIRDIFTTHQAMLRDPALREEVQVRLQKGLSAEAAWMEKSKARRSGRKRCMTSAARRACGRPARRGPSRAGLPGRCRSRAGPG